MSTFAQETYNDLQIRDGQLVLLTRESAVAATQLRNRFQFVKGEFFLDTRQGIPFFEFVFVKNPDVLLIKQLFKQVIVTTPGVTELLDMSVSFDAKERKLSFSFLARAEDGQVISGGSGRPFIVEQP